MRILMIVPMYRPEMGAAAARFYPFVQQLVSSGHEVFVATTMPNYPRGVVYEGYRGKRFVREQMDGATVFRTISYVVPRNVSKWGQLMSYLSSIPAYFWGGLKAGKVDVIFVSSPPLFTVLPALWLKRIRRAKLAFDVRDLWPDELVAMGVAEEGSRPIRLMRRMEQAIYRGADKVLCTTPAFARTVIERGVLPEATADIPNGADVDLFRPLPKDNEKALALGLQGKFVAMYSGLMGLKFGLEILIEVARLLRPHEDIVLFLRGTGPKRQWLAEAVEKEGLRNVVFGDEVPLEDVPYLMAVADVCLALLTPDPYLEKIISVKNFDYMSIERPVVAALRGEGARVITEAQAGIVVDPGDAQAMADAVLELRGDPQRAREMGRRGREFVVQNYSRRVTAEKLERTLREMVESRKRG